MRPSGVALLLVSLAACDDRESLSPAPGAGGPAGAAGSGQAGGPAGGGQAGASGGGQAGAGVSGASGQAGGSGQAGCEADPPVAEQAFEGSKDPTGGEFTLAQALAGLPEGPGPLRAVLTTDKGVLTCTLRPDAAPVGVASFVGLARGTRPSRHPKTKKWVTRRFYDGLLFHRVIPGFVAQGGDPQGTGVGGPGYTFADEIGLLHEPGALAYANSGPDTNGSQFYVAERALPDLDGGYTVFGLCTPVAVVTALTSVPTNPDTDRPLEKLVLQRVDITRCAP